jgi:raffinose/stachyose/melibiose transport system substrate-binding protein
MKCERTVLLAMGLVVVAGMVFAGGGGQNRTSGNISIELWHIQTNEARKKFLEDAVKRFEQQNPGLRVNLSVYENEPYKTKLKTVSGSDFPDVFHSWGGGWLKTFVDAGLVADITGEAQGIENVIGNANKMFATYDGKVYGLPINGSTTVLFYNKDVFSRYNLQPPRTLAELDNVAKILLANNVTPFALGNLTKWTGAQHFVLLSMRIGGPDIFQQVMDKKAQFIDEPFIRAGQLVLDQNAKRYFPIGANGVNTDTGGERMMFYSGEYGMLVQLSGILGPFKSENPEFLKKVGMIPYPAVDGGRGRVQDQLGGYNCFSVSSNTKYKDIAAKLAIFLATDEQFQNELVTTFTLPARQGLKSDEPLMQDILNMLNTATYFQNYIDQTLSPALAEKHKDTTQALYANTMTSLQVGQEMQKDFDAGL